MGVSRALTKAPQGLCLPPAGGRAVRPPLLRKIKNDLKPELGAIFYAGEGGRTLTPLELVPKTSASAIPPLPHGNFIYSSKIRRKSQLPKDNSLFASA